MEEKKSTRVKRIIGLSIIFLLFYIAGYLIATLYLNRNIMDNQTCINLNKSYHNLKQVLYLEELEYKLGDLEDHIQLNYDLMSNSYDIQDYKNAIFYCEKSREYSNKYSQELRNILAKYPEDLSELLKVRKKMVETDIEIYFALYEACEYMESASRSYDNEKWSSGDINVEGQNRAINRHDNLVEEYNRLLAKYNLLKEEMLK
jgi:DNA repair ATPase RecN